MNVFVKPADYYQREFNIVEDGLLTHARYISLSTGKPVEYCLEWLRNNTGVDKLIPLADPKVKILYRGDNGDRELVETSFNSMLNRVRQEKLIMAPTMTAYLPPEQLKSIIALFQEKNITGRNEDKQMAFQYQRANDPVKTTYYNNRQNSRKIKNNAVSGTHAIPNNPFFLKSAHSTLTSGCRVITGYTNATNEKFIMGNRHYWAPDVAVSNILTTINLTDLDSVARVMTKYNLNYPTVQQTVDCIARGSEKEWHSVQHMERITRLLSNTTEVQRAAIMFIADFYHLHIVNPQFAENMLRELGHVPATGIDDADEYIKLLDNDQKILMSIVCCDVLKVGEKSVSIKECKDANPEGYRLLGACAKNILERVDYYADFYRVFYTTKNLPGSINYIPDIKRHCVVGSDTDSSIVTVQHWTHTITGHYSFTDQDRCIAAAIIYLATQVITHVIATVSGNMGIPDQYKFTIQMKNEFLFPMLSLTGLAKHYYAKQLAKEGNILPELVTEIKGVHLRSSRLPPDLKQHLRVFIEAVMERAISGEQTDINRILNEVMYLENKIDNSIQDGQVIYTMKEKINNTYAKEEGSKLIHWHLWRDVFARKYGVTPEPPYRGVKLQMNLPKRAVIDQWIETIQDPYIKTNMRAWLERTGKQDIGNFILPDGIVRSSGIPHELRNAVDTRLMKKELLSGFYLVLKSLGLFIMGNKIDTIVSDFHKHYDPNYRLTTLE